MPSDVAHSASRRAPGRIPRSDEARAWPGQSPSAPPPAPGQPTHGQTPVPLRVREHEPLTPDSS